MAALSGRLDPARAPEFSELMSGLIDSGVSKILIDGAELDYVSSAGIAELSAAGKKLAVSGGSLAFAVLTDYVRTP